MLHLLFLCVAATEEMAAENAYFAPHAAPTAREMNQFLEGKLRASPEMRPHLESLRAATAAEEARVRAEIAARQAR